MFKNKVYIVLSVLILAAYALVSYSIFISRPLMGARETLYAITALIPVLASAYFVALFGFRGSRGRNFILLSLGFLMFFIGESLWIIKDYFFNIFPFPSIIDVFFISGYPLILWGLVREAKSSAADFSIRKNKLFILLIVIFSAVVLYFGIYKTYDIEANFWENLFNTFYGLGDFLLIIVCFLIIKVSTSYSRGSIFYPWLFIALNFVVMFIADMSFAYFTGPYGDNINVQTSIDLLWMLSYLLFGYGMISYYGVIKKEMSELITKFKDSKYYSCLFWKNFYSVFAVILLILYFSLSLFYKEGDIYFIFGRFCYLLIIVMAIVGTRYTSRTYGRNNLHGRAFLFLTVALVALFLGEFSATLENSFTFNIFSYLKISDILLILAYPFFFLAAYFELKSGNLQNIIKELNPVAIFIFLIPLALILYFDLIFPFNYSQGMANNLITLLFGIGDIVVYISLFLILLIVREYRKGKIFPAWLLIMFSVIVMAIGDIVLAVFGNNKGANPELVRFIVSDVWIFAYVLAGYGSLKLGCIIREKQEEIRMIVNK